MAILSRIQCGECHQVKDVMHAAWRDSPALCDDCAAKETIVKRHKALHALAQLTTEERLRRIEEWIYDYRPQYVPPPRF